MMKCSHQPTQLWPEIVPCPNPATTYMFGDPYCPSCYARLVELHAMLNAPKTPHPMVKKIPKYLIWFRQRIEVNTDPQRRCYNGCHFSSEMRWTEWSGFGQYSKEDAESSAKTFREINRDREYKVLPEGEKP